MFQEQKIREGLYMMGLKDGIFHLSWFITYALQVNRFSLCIWIESPLLHVLARFERFGL
jgi:hypothetical protein